MLLEVLEAPDYQEIKDRRVISDLRVLLGYKEVLELRAPQVHLDFKDQLETEGKRVLLGNQDHQEIRDPVALLVCLEMRANKDNQD